MESEGVLQWSQRESEVRHMQDSTLLTADPASLYGYK